MRKKDVTAKEADGVAAMLKQKDQLEKAILEEAILLTTGEQNSIQQLIAYGRQLLKLQKPQKDRKY